MNNHNKHAMGFVVTGLTTGWVVFGIVALLGYAFLCVRYNICPEPPV